MISAGEEILNSMFDPALGIAVIVDYVRDNAVMARGIPAKIGDRFQIKKTDDLNIRTREADFLIRYSDLNLIPMNRDVIVYNNEKYQVVTIPGGDCYRWHTRRTHTIIRIFTKYSGIQPPPEA